MGCPLDSETLAAIRRHLVAPEPRDHVAFLGGLAFEDEGQMIVASDEQILDVITDMDLSRELDLPEDLGDGASHL